MKNKLNEIIRQNNKVIEALEKDIKCNNVDDKKVKIEVALRACFLSNKALTEILLNYITHSEYKKNTKNDDYDFMDVFKNFQK